uniref:Uncharacterized protein n=1 Tax=Anopheles dirus TaxID=7168 RepID=A0A182NDJ0_9DIPT
GVAEWRKRSPGAAQGRFGTAGRWQPAVRIQREGTAWVDRDFFYLFYHSLSPYLRGP